MTLSLQVLHLSPFLSLCSNEETETHRDQTASEEYLVGCYLASPVTSTFQISSLCIVHCPFDWAWPYSLALANGILTSVLQAEAWKYLNTSICSFGALLHGVQPSSYEEAQATTWKRPSRNKRRILANRRSQVPSWQPATADPVSGAILDFAAFPVP